MGATSLFHHIEKFEMGETGDGIAGTSLTQYRGIKEGTFNLNFAEPTITNINIEESEAPEAVIAGAVTRDFTGELVGVNLEDFVKFYGGVWTVADKEYAFPIITPIINQTIKITCYDKDGAKVEITLPKANLVSSMTGVLGKSDGRGINIKGTILTPVSALGVASSPILIKSLAT